MTHVQKAGSPGTSQSMSEILNELLTRTYSDEGTPLGTIGTALWRILDAELREWLVRPN